MSAGEYHTSGVTMSDVLECWADYGQTDPQDMAREILRVLPQVVSVLPPDEAREALNTAEAFMV